MVNISYLPLQSCVTTKNICQEWLYKESFITAIFRSDFLCINNCIVDDAREGFVLEQVYILLNPGITSSESIQNCVQASTNSHQLASHTDQLLKNTALHNNFQNIPVANSSVHCRKGELHPLAHLQLQELGKWYKKRYIEKWNLESSQIAPKHFRLHSVDGQDTLSSLISFLHGLLPNYQFQKTIIHKVDATATINKRRLKNSDAGCNFLSNLTNHLRKHFAGLSQGFHEMGNFSSVILPKLCTSLSQNFRSLTTENMVQNALLAVDKGLKWCSSLKKCQDLADLHAYSWLQEFVSNVKMKNQVFEKVFIYAVDKVFLSYLMSAFRYRNVKATHPGSHITIEIYRNLYERVNPYYLKILYNDVDITHQIPLCTKFPPWSFCKLKYFVDFQKLKYKTLFKSSPDVQKKCQFSLLN